MQSRRVVACWLGSAQRSGACWHKPGWEMVLRLTKASFYDGAGSWVTHRFRVRSPADGSCYFCRWTRSPSGVGSGDFWRAGQGVCGCGCVEGVGLSSRVFAGGWLPPVLHPTGCGTAHRARCVAKSTKVAAGVDFGGFWLRRRTFHRFLGVGDGRVSRCTATVAVHADMGRPSDYRRGLVYR